MQCRQRLSMVVGATNVIFCMHQNHPVPTSHREPRGTNPLGVPTIEVINLRLSNERPHAAHTRYHRKSIPAFPASLIIASLPSGADVGLISPSFRRMSKRFGGAGRDAEAE